MCTNYAPFAETLVTCPWQTKLLQKGYGKQIQYDNNDANMLPVRQNKYEILKHSKEKNDIATRNTL